MIVAPADSAPARATTEKRSKWARPLEGSVMALGVLALLALYLGDRVWNIAIWGHNQRYDRQAVMSTLEAQGFTVTGVRPYGATDNCTGYVYRWKAVGAEGRACVHHDGDVSAWAEKRWPAMGRPAAPAS